MATACVALFAAPALPLAGAQGPPDLVSDPPEDVEIAVYDVDGEDRLLVRFDSFIHNRLGAGVGPVEVLGTAQMTGSLADQSKPALDVRQRIGGTDTPVAGGDMVFALSDDANFDSHDHWHFQRAAAYSIVTTAGAPAAPGAKVGFCLLDSIRVSSGAPGAAFTSPTLCTPRNLAGTGLNDTIRMGITPGHRDIYDSGLAHQWVDATDLLPGDYKLRAVVDPDDLITEVDESNGAGELPITLPGYLPQGLTIGRGTGPSVTFALDSTGVGATKTVPQYRLVDAPGQGALSMDGSWQTDPVVTYTPGAGWAGGDTFTYAVREDGSPFPSVPTKATVAITPDGAPAIAIGSVPGQMVAGTTVQLTSTPAAKSWRASAGSISPTGLYTAPAAVPPGGGTATITAVGPDQAAARVAVKIVPPPANDALPLPPAAPAGETLPSTPADPLAPRVPQARALRAALGKVRAARIGRFVAVSAVAGRAGRLTITLRKGRRRIKGCIIDVRAGAAHTCRIRRPRGERSALRVIVVMRPRAGASVTRTLALKARKRARASSHRH